MGVSLDGLAVQLHLPQTGFPVLREIDAVGFAVDFNVQFHGRPRSASVRAALFQPEAVLDFQRPLPAAVPLPFAGFTAGREASKSAAAMTVVAPCAAEGGAAGSTSRRSR